MKYLLTSVAIIGLLATPAQARVKLRDVVVGAVVGGVAAEVVHESNRFNRYEPRPGYVYVTPNYYVDPCSYYPPDYLVRSDPVRAEYIRGEMARACEEQRERMNRAYYCGYNGHC